MTPEKPEMPENWNEIRESVRRQIVQQCTQAGKSPGLIASMDLFSTRLFDSIVNRIASPLASRVAELEKEVRRLKWQLSQFKVQGTDGCASCYMGRVTLFIANEKCIKCDPESYEIPEKFRAALSEPAGGVKSGL